MFFQLPKSLVNDIIALTMPQQTVNDKEKTMDYLYCFVIRTSKLRPSSEAIEGESEEKEPALADVAPAIAASPFVYCYVAYRQTVGLKKTAEGTVSTLNKQALVIVSLLPIPNLAYSILSTIESTLYHVLHPSGDGDDDSDSTEMTNVEKVYKTFEVAMDQIRSSWADLDLVDDGSTWKSNLSLPLFGEVKKYTNIQHTHNNTIHATF